ncbi:unnamed protein product [Notodromas monacha]|uniref:Succinate--CoA ligase [GDP-forming] subunit beta, mitochondrial n=1 Tax=Notodromas monacha TaxID=399045 RepID=A0A7R9BKW3_9CRUS|nr:unnamed protein product [Notodromas monacha]CAG0917365.1 unnamed protein product [Notodromas monacha]
MLASLRKAVNSPRASCAVLQQTLRRLSLLEYQSKDLLAQHGVSVQKFRTAGSPKDAEQISREFRADEYVIKAQILAGGRGKGVFDTGFKGGVHLTKKPEEVPGLVNEMLGHKLITKQTPKDGIPVTKVMVAESVDITREVYVCILLDRSRDGPIIIASPAGGMDIEGVAEKTPHLIKTFPVPLNGPLSETIASEVVKFLQFESSRAPAAVRELQALWNLFTAVDATQVEINPLAETKDGRVVAVDAKINFDDNAEFRQREIFSLEDAEEKDPREVQAEAFKLNYIGMDGNIGCLVNGAGLAMATMDIVKLHGGNPANFLDVGGSVQEDQVYEAFRLLTSDSRVEAILVNVFAGIVNCATIAKGIVKASKTIGLSVPLVVRLEGTNVDEARRILAESEMTIVMAHDLDDAAKKAVESTQERKMHSSTNSKSEERKFAMIREKTIQLICGSAGYDVDEKAYGLIAGDLSYRIRDLIYTSKIFMRSANRKKLTVDDINRTLKLKHFPSILGHSSKDTPVFKHVEQGGFYFTEDSFVKLVDLAFDKTPFFFHGPSHVQTRWLDHGSPESDFRSSPIKVQQLDQKPPLVENREMNLGDELLEMYQTAISVVLSAELTDVEGEAIVCPILELLMQPHNPPDSVEDIHLRSKCLRVLSTLMHATCNGASVRESMVHAKLQNYFDLPTENHRGISRVLGVYTTLSPTYVLKDIARTAIDHMDHILSMFPSLYSESPDISCAFADAVGELKLCLYSVYKHLLPEALDDLYIGPGVHKYSLESVEFTRPADLLSSFYDFFYGTFGDGMLHLLLPLLIPQESYAKEIVRPRRRKVPEEPRMTRYKSAFATWRTKFICEPGQWFERCERRSWFVTVNFVGAKSKPPEKLRCPRNRLNHPVQFFGYPKGRCPKVDWKPLPQLPMGAEKRFCESLRCPPAKNMFDHFYAVIRGHNPGIYYCWEDCQEEIAGFVGAHYVKCFTLEDAEAIFYEPDPVRGRSRPPYRRYPFPGACKQPWIPPRILRGGRSAENGVFDFTDDGYAVCYADGSCMGRLKNAGVGVWFGDDHVA